MTDLIRFLAVLGRINPAIWDVIIPRGPRTQEGITLSQAVEVELNPQPIPPGHELLAASARVAHQIAFAAIAAEAGGADPDRIMGRALDDWCGTGKPHLPIPWPDPWPFPWPPDPEPRPEWDVAASRVVGALSLASVASRLAEGQAKEVISKGAERLLEAGLNE